MMSEKKASMAGIDQVLTVKEEKWKAWEKEKEKKIRREEASTSSFVTWQESLASEDENETSVSLPPKRMHKRVKKMDVLLLSLPTF